MATDWHEARAVIVDLVVLKDRAMRVGLVRTAHSMDEASQVAGWELADLLEESDE